MKRDKVTKKTIKKYIYKKIESCQDSASSTYYKIEECEKN